MEFMTETESYWRNRAEGYLAPLIPNTVLSLFFFFPFWIQLQWLSQSSNLINVSGSFEKWSQIC